MSETVDNVMPDFVSKAVDIARGMVDAQKTDHKFGYHAVVWLASALEKAERERDEMRPVVDAVLAWRDTDEADDVEGVVAAINVHDAADDYRAMLLKVAG